MGVAKCGQIDGKLQGDNYERVNLGNTLVLMQNVIAVHGINLI